MMSLWNSPGFWWRWPIAVTFCLWATIGCSRGEPEGPGDAIGFGQTDRPSFLLITLDTTRADHLEPYGAENVETPALSELAENGIVFERAFATAPITAPAHASLLTGLYPLRHGIRDNLTYYLRDDIPTLAERLSEIGYQTAAFVSAAVLERHYGLDQGFDVYDDRIRSSNTDFERRSTIERRAGVTTDRALVWLDTLRSDEPYFLWVHFYDPHIPYSPPSPWAEEYRDQPYDGEIAYMDSQIGRLLQHPRVGGDDVMVMAVGDHGESLGEHGESTHGLLVYDSTLRVPWILRLPGGPSGVRINAPISQVDLVPTVMDLLALDPKTDYEELEGRSLVPILRGEGSTRERLLFAETEAPFFSYGWSRLRTVRQGAMKFIDAPVVELYDLGRDPDELQNLAADRTTDLRRLALEVEKWAAQADDIDSTVTVDSETAEQLRALGYVAGDPGRPEGQGRGNPVELLAVHEELQVVGKLLRSGQPQEAAQRAQYALTMDPENLTALRDLSLAHLLLGRIDEAAAVAARASAAAPWSALALFTEADVEIHRGRYQRALDLLDRALELNDHLLEARLERSRCLASLGRNDEAVAELESLLEAFPDNNWVALRYAEIVELPSGDYDAAERRLRMVISRNPAFAQAWLLLGTVLTRAGRVSDAVSLYREAIASGSANTKFLCTSALAQLLTETSDPAAETALREAIRSSPAVRADLHVTLGELLSAQGRRDEARHQFEIAGTAPAHSVGTRNSKGMALLRLGLIDEAETVWRELTRDHPESCSGWMNLASVSIERQDWSEAERFARTAIARDPTEVGAWVNLGIALEGLGRTQEAETAYRRAVEIDKRDSQALFNLGILLRTSSRYEEAAIVQQEVLARNPAHSGAHFELGILYAEFLGEIELAKVHLQATIDADPNHPLAQQARFVLDQLP